MGTYAPLLEVLSDAPAALALHALRSLIAVGSLALAGLWLPLAVSPAASRDSSWLAAAALASGLAMAALCWTLSFLAMGSPVAGHVALAGFAAAGAVRAWRGRSGWAGSFSSRWIWVASTLFALALSLWHHGATELPSSGDPRLSFFNDQQRDLSIHVMMAGLVAEAGLPMQNLLGAADVEYASLRHTGHLALIAGLASALSCSLYESAVALWTLANVLTAWAALALLSGRVVPGWLRVGVVFATLCWGAAAVPSAARLLEPTQPGDDGTLELAAMGFWVAARGFSNITQQLSIALTLGGLLFVDLFAVAKREGGRAGPLLAAALLLWIVGAWTKPSLIIFYIPALFLWLGLNAAAARDYACVLAAIAAGVFVYILPAWVAPLAEGSGWSASFDVEQAEQVGRFLLLATPGLWFLAVSPLVALARRLGRVRQASGEESWSLLELCLIAAGGSLVFSLVFREDSFVGYRYFQPNLWWGMSGCIVLLVPLLGRRAMVEWDVGGWRRALAGTGLTIAALHTLNGASLAVVVPALNVRGHEAARADVLEQARAETSPGTRFALDPTLQDLDLVSYLSRPALVSVAGMRPVDTKALQAWLQFCVRGEALQPALLDRFDAVVIDSRRSHVAATLGAQRWKRTPLGSTL